MHTLAEDEAPATCLSGPATVSALHTCVKSCNDSCETDQGSGLADLRDACRQAAYRARLVATG